MSGKADRRIRRAVKHEADKMRMDQVDMVRSLCAWPLKSRVRFAWMIIFKRWK